MSTELNDGDFINVSAHSGILPETITLTGQFKYPGQYSILQGDTIKDIIERLGVIIMMHM